MKAWPGVGNLAVIWAKWRLHYSDWLRWFSVIYYIRTLIRKNYHNGYIICAGLIFAGALGNLIDSMFYGLIFEESTYDHVAKIFPHMDMQAFFMEELWICFISRLSKHITPVGFRLLAEMNLNFSVRYLILPMHLFPLALLHFFFFRKDL